ncbi:unnamed protein product [Didymodactylos carnosus]|uniref:Uncharacterized protein n=1 Tax=Didymodactylos carnosus TaxID=1234261 RepID=A0A8S2N2N0_9BILA|nr:unnamed protein product [Didymodactylos carnosus]CAF3986286.1 unnamed protein product [Didymodactylos carnosus]
MDETTGMNIYSRMATGGAQQQRDARNAMFMYFQLLIDILLGITGHDSKSKQNLIDHFRQLYDGNKVEEKVIEEYEREYKRGHVKSKYVTCSNSFEYCRIFRFQYCPSSRIFRFEYSLTMVSHSYKPEKQTIR